MKVIYKKLEEIIEKLEKNIRNFKRTQKYQ